MSNLFGGYSNDPRVQKQMLTSRYSSARVNLLLMVAFSAINILMLATNSGMYFLFSASIPYLLTDMGMFFCGMYPAEFYTGEFEGMVFADKSIFVVLLVISFLILGIYLLCWFFSKKNKVNWLITALVLFSFDTVIMLLNYGLTALVDLGFHIWVIVILAMGINAHYKLKKMPAEEVVIEGEFTEINEEPVSDSVPETEAQIDAPSAEETEEK